MRATPALVAHWRLDEAIGPTIADDFGTHDGTTMGVVPAFRQGPALTSEAGFSTRFNGGGWFEVPNSPMFGTTFSLELWVFMSTLGTNGQDRQLAYKDPGTASSRQLFFGFGQGGVDQLEVNFNTSTSGYYFARASTAFVAGGWHHVVLIVEPGVGARIWVDANQVANKPMTAAEAPMLNTATLDFGAGSVGSPPIRLDECAWYSRALTPAEIQNHYLIGTSAAPDGGTPDGGSPDGGSPDGGTPDAGGDAGTSDGGPGSDAGAGDAGADAGTGDGGPSSDAGAEDAGADAGANDGGSIS